MTILRNLSPGRCGLMMPTALGLYYDAFFADPILRSFYGGSGYANLGYWTPETNDALEAGDLLGDQLVAPYAYPEAEVLEVACGEGATTARLCAHFQPERITAIGLAHGQLTEARTRAPECDFLQMDATRLGFTTASFDIVVSVEAAFHFDTRKDFLAEAFRILKPGGMLVLSDLLMTAGTPLVPKQNRLTGSPQYAELLRQSGFADAKLTDVTDQTWRAYRPRFTRPIAERPSWVRRGEGIRDLLAANVALAWAIRSCVLVCARKP